MYKNTKARIQTPTHPPTHGLGGGHQLKINLINTLWKFQIKWGKFPSHIWEIPFIFGKFLMFV